MALMDVCPDGQPHNYIYIVDDWVYCTRCLKTVQLTFDVQPTPIPPNPSDPRPVFRFASTGGDDTNNLQNFFNSSPNDAIYEIQGMVGISKSGVRLSGKTHVSVRGLASSGFFAMSSGVYTGPSAAMMYVEGGVDCSFEDLDFDCNNKPAMGLFVSQTRNCRMLRCEVWNIGVDNGVPAAGMHGERNTDPEVAECYVHDTAPEVRGIWFGVGDRHDVRPHIHHCMTRHTGHTGIITEAEGPLVEYNQVYDSYANGTGYKFIARGNASVDARYDNNLVDGTKAGAGFMIEGSPVDPHIFVRNWVAKNCGPAGSTFGFLYVSSSQDVRNVEVDVAQLENCKSIGAAQYLKDSAIRNIALTNTPDLFHYELNCSNIHQDNAGRANLGQGNRDIWVNGTKVA